ncbi:hypothetical protein BT96DRAFT_855255 [Gymnopus androsaceus JB14]|uniref:DUF6534 domain-containing protein n=1 Tax=Gymnopus androsaceus JB14 TaxID=1447944 RepID=A0A6A4I163_9AGAR|nr:hypothetical protein BT96DRAFT_1025774 [Gymnopus androsaceus JB14]KAE9402937.1 hypothetical protein BT96DRAFT_855255 [Gymnopus androsaceus JB14]
MSSLSVVLGPIVLGVVFNSILFGTCLVQAATYFSNQFKDKWPIFALLCWVFVVDTFHSITIIYLSWYYIVLNWGNTAVFAATPWEFNWTPVFLVLIAAPVQIFLTWRIYKLSGTKWVFLICVVTLASSAIGIYSTYTIVNASASATVKELIPAGDAWLASGIASDTLITSLLFFYLIRSRTGFSGTNRMIYSILTTAVETAAPVLVVACLDIAFLTAYPATNLHFMFVVCLPRLYTNTLLSTLNSRKKFKTDSEAAQWNSIHLTQRLGNVTANSQHGIQIDVERQIHGETLDYAKRGIDDYTRDL